MALVTPGTCHTGCQAASTRLLTVIESAAESESHSDAAAATQLLPTGLTQRLGSGKAAQPELLPEPAKEGVEPVQLQRTASPIYSQLSLTGRSKFCLACGWGQM